MRGESADGSDELPVNPSVRALGNPDVHMLALNGRAKTSALHVAALFRFASQCAGFEPCPRTRPRHEDVRKDSDWCGRSDDFTNASATFEDGLVKRIYIEEDPMGAGLKRGPTRMAQTRRMGIQNECAQRA